MQIGRITGLTEPHDWTSTQDDGATISADYQATSVTDGMTRRDQILGYPTTDELVIPVILTSEARSSGFYKPIRSQVLTDQLSRVGGKIFNYSVELQRLASFANPWIESVLSGARLTNAIGAVDADTEWFHAVPSSRLEYTHSAVPASLATRASADGNMAMVYDTNVTGIPALARWSIAPANYYVGAARVSQGSTLVQLVGRTMVQSDSVNWEMQNGLVRVTGDSAAGLNLKAYNGSSWSSGTVFSISIGGIAFSAGNASLSVLRNSPEECVVRLTANGSGSLAREIASIDLALRRGDRLVRGYLSSSFSAGWTIGLGAFGPAGTAITFAAWTGGAVRKTANDGDGNRPVVLSMQAATTTDTTHTNLTLTANSKTFDFGIGLEVGGSGAAAPEDAVSLARQYLAAQSEEQRVVAR